MKKQSLTLTSALIVAAMMLSACSGVASALNKTASQVDIAKAASQTSTATAATSGGATSTTSTSTTTTTAPVGISGGSDLLAAYESTLESIYTTVNPQVVNIDALSPATNSNSTQNFPGFNNNQNNQTPQYSEALGSGFIWDNKGDIVTNNHVIDGATKIEVTFSDGTTVPATIVGQDLYSDLAVIKVSVDASKLIPVTMADSSQVKVGELAIAIGNPYGFNGSMSTGTVSGLGREIPTGSADPTSGGYYNIPDVIQTDASINPGNSGGVLVNDLGQVMGVTSDYIPSSSGSSTLIGFAIPAEIVSKVIPALITSGKYEHPYLGISGMDMSPDIAQAMNLPTDTRGALVETVTAGGPSDKAGLKGSTTTVTINGVQGTVGGDVITAVDGQTVTSMSDIISYLAIHTEVGQTISLTILRDGKTQTVQVTLGSRPTQ